VQGSLLRLEKGLLREFRVSFVFLLMFEVPLVCNFYLSYDFVFEDYYKNDSFLGQGTV